MASMKTWDERTFSVLPDFPCFIALVCTGKRWIWPSKREDTSQLKKATSPYGSLASFPAWARRRRP